MAASGEEAGGRRGTRPPRFLFVPVSGPGGSGEHYRALALASAALRHWAHAEVRFVVNRHAPYAAGVPHPATFIDGSPTDEGRAVIECIRAFRPDVAVFDSSGRAAQYRAARACGARVVYVSSRPRTRWKGFRPRRMRLLDQHWVLAPRVQGGALGPWERAKLLLAPRLEVLFLDGLHEPVAEAPLARCKADLGVEARGYVLLCPGGGGLARGPDVQAAFLGAAREVAARTALTPVLVAGPPPPGGRADDRRVRVVGPLPNEVLMGLVRDAALAVTGGGALLTQALMLGAACVCAPVNVDQPGRIARYARQGLVRPARLSAEPLARETLALLRDEDRRRALRSAVASAGLANGLDAAVDAFARALDGRVVV